ncbi:unnamed protein product [Gongylonema pulchrum]|uniref:Uncharacterized protein n=1 Tax=Gongylonema pulchrum TaxID=637853 RepID=A0A183END3_9BILA|nr:unnamed protein product [Gongylonema pulchrum]
MKISRRFQQNRSRSLGVHQRRQVRKQRRPTFPMNLDGTAAAVAATTSRELSPETLEAVSGRFQQNRSRSLGAHQRRQVRKQRRPTFPVNLDGTAAAVAATTSKELSPETLEAVSGYSSDISSYPEQEQLGSPVITPPYHSLIDCVPVASPENRQQSTSFVKKTNNPVMSSTESTSKFPYSCSPFQRISFEKHQIL